MAGGNAGRVEALYSLAEGSVFIGTSASEFWTDSAQHNADVRPYFDGSDGRLRIEAGEAIVVVEGTTGWTIDRPAFVLPDGSRIEARLTLIWHQEDGAWKVVHSHASVGQAD
jgi:ketosteroid isomerase-like protein